jgi:hypothetical protein
MTQQPQYPQVYPPVPRPATRKGTGLRIVLLIVALTVTCFAGVAVGAVFAQPEANGTSTAAAPPERVAEPGTASVGASPAKTQAPTLDDGVWVVGDDMPAGRYRATETVSSRCYWEISKTGGEGLSDIISNDLPGGGRPQVTLKKGQTFKTDNCGTWRKV